MQFQVWTPFHYAMIVFPFVLAGVLHYIFRDKPSNSKRNMALALSVLMIIILEVSLARGLALPDGLSGSKKFLEAFYG